MDKPPRRRYFGGALCIIGRWGRGLGRDEVLEVPVSFRSATSSPSERSPPDVTPSRWRKPVRVLSLKAAASPHPGEVAPVIALSSRLRLYARPAAVILTLGMLPACEELLTGTLEDERLYFMNSGPCDLIFRFDGGIAAGTQGIDHRPQIGEWNDVPLEGAGTVTVSIGTLPNSQVSCAYQIEIDSNSRFVFEGHDTFHFGSGRGGTGQGYGFGFALTPLSYSPHTYGLVDRD